jgi:cytoskeletal protein RodZ
MRKQTLVVVTGILVIAGVGIWAMVTYVAANPERASTAKPAIATVSPFEIMKERVKDLPPARYVDPF